MLAALFLEVSETLRLRHTWPRPVSPTPCLVRSAIARIASDERWTFLEGSRLTGRLSCPYSAHMSVQRTQGSVIMTGPTAALGVWDGLSAKAAESAGAQMLCASGFAISASYGLPDAELYTLTENLAAIERIRESSSLPIIGLFRFQSACRAPRPLVSVVNEKRPWVKMEIPQDPSHPRPHRAIYRLVPVVSRR